MLGWQ
ncbi:hypothetical protein YPPY102_3683, partial [Yersinia pestis PY-102]